MTDWSLTTKLIATLAVDIPIILFLCWLAFWKKRCKHLGLEHKVGEGFRCLDCERRPK